MNVLLLRATPLGGYTSTTLGDDEPTVGPLINHLADPNDGCTPSEATLYTANGRYTSTTTWCSSNQWWDFPSMIILCQDDEPIRLLGLRYIQLAAATPLRPLVTTNQWWDPPLRPMVGSSMAHLYNLRVLNHVQNQDTNLAVF